MWTFFDRPPPSVMLSYSFFFFFMLALLRRTYFWPPSMVYISVINTNITNYNLSHVGPLWAAFHVLHIPNTKFIWIPNTMGIRYSNGKVTWLGWPFQYRTFWTTNRLFQSSPIFKPPFEYWTIWQPDTNLPIQFQTSPVFRWLQCCTRLFVSENQMIIVRWLVEPFEYWSITQIADFFSAIQMSTGKLNMGFF